jgi:nicotinamidase-related amidase
MPTRPAPPFMSAFAPQDGDIIVRKTRVGAFSTTDLERQLRDPGITTLILAGDQRPISMR